MATIDKDTQIKDLLRHLFNSAAAMSLAVINQDDAEPEMARFLHTAKSHPDQRPFVVQLFVESFSDKFHMKWEPWEFMQFCVHDLRWSELRDFIRAKRDEDVQNRGARSSTIWNDILRSFEDDWIGAKQFHEFGQRP